ncbi:MAG: hypothetical protein PVI66_10620 [Candidatus Aminicenantes bacterium]
MKNKILIFVCIGVFILCSLSTMAETKKLREIGRYKFANIEEVVPPADAMKLLVDKYADDIQNGFNMAGHGDLYAPFMDEVKQAAFVERDLAVGDTIEWMLFRSGGKIKLTEDLEWAGDAALPVLAFTVVDNNKTYEFIMPRACGNIALQKVTEGVPKPTETPYQEEQEEDLYQIEKAKIYQDIYALLSETDLYCSIFIMDDPAPEMVIIGAERGWERTMITDGEVVYLNKGRNDGLETGQLFLIFEIPREIPGYGPLAVKRGRARIVDLEDTRCSAKIEKACGPVMKGNYLVPFEEKESRLGKDLGYDVPPHKADGLDGTVVYLETEFNQIGTGYWAILDLGEEDGVQVGQQLIIYREEEKDAPLYIFGNVVIIDVQQRSCTVKSLSARDAIRMGDLVMSRPTR